MSKLSELISNLCPDGVEFKVLEQCCNILDNQRKPITKHFRVSGEYPYYGANGIQDYVSDYIFDGKFVLVGEDGSVITPNGNPVVNWAEGKIWVNNHAHVISEKDGILLRYLFYYLQTVDVVKLVHGNIPKLTNKDFRAIRVPIPPLEIQREIVRILDKFVDANDGLISLLQRELILRQKQYEFYSSKLFVESSNDWIELSRLADFVYGYTDTARDEGDARFIRITDIDDQGYLKEEEKKFITLTETARKSLLKNGDIIVARIGATFGKTLFFDRDYPSVFASYLIKIIPCEKLMRRYYWHFTKTSLYWEQANKLVAIGGQQQFNSNALRKIKIPVPSLEKQKKIVAILDRFDKLCNDLTAGIPAEIQARQKQYIFYRDKLLSFKTKGEFF